MLNSPSLSSFICKINKPKQHTSKLLLYHIIDYYIYDLDISHDTGRYIMPLIVFGVRKGI